MLSTPVRRLRFIGFVEGISYLVLLGIAMPLKYFAGNPQAVRIVGSVHGALFILFFAAVLEVSIRRPWWSGKFWGTAFIASIVPLGTFWFDAWLKAIESTDEALDAEVARSITEGRDFDIARVELPTQSRSSDA